MKIIQQNILRVPADAVICHQVNCLGIMGGGLALQVRNEYPKVYEVYKAKTDWRLGDCQIVQVGGYDRFIANLAGQQDIGGGCQTNLAALEQALRPARDFADSNGLTLYLPHMIGCGLAGGDWIDVSAMIERVTPNAIICKYIP